MRRFLAALFLLGGVLAPAARAASPSVPATPLVIYSASAATTAQAPLWGAMADGWGATSAWRSASGKTGRSARRHLAGKGDIWSGHLDGFAQAARRGAPITLIAGTAWAEKFQFLTLDAEPTSPAALSERMAALHETLAVTPQGSPALAILDAARAEGGPAFRPLPLPPQQIGLGLARGAIRPLMVPDPLAAA
jgi:NitT/TauT family transport system substrate-binding protein